MPSNSKLYLYKRDNGYYYIGYTISGKIRWKTTKEKLKIDALRVLSEFEKLLKEKPREKSLLQFSNEFLAYCQQNYARNTVILYRLSLKHLQSLVSERLLSQITPQDIDKYKGLRLQQVSEVSVNIELECLRAMFNTAIRWKLLENNPCHGIRFVYEPEQQPMYFTKANFQKLRSLIKEGWLKELIIFAVLTGMRRGEIVNLRWQDVDLQRKVIQIQSNATFKTKQGKRRTIPMSEVAFHLLQSRFGKGTSEFVFSLNDQKISEGWLTHKFKYYVYEAKLNNDKLHFHSLRHTFASWLVQDGVSLYEVQKLLGHSNISVTQVYSHLQPETLHSTVNRIAIEMN